MKKILLGLLLFVVGIAVFIVIYVGLSLSVRGILWKNY
jgi:hypothetical protein